MHVEHILPYLAIECFLLHSVKIHTIKIPLFYLNFFYCFRDNALADKGGKNYEAHSLNTFRKKFPRNVKIKKKQNTKKYCSRDVSRTDKDKIYVFVYAHKNKLRKAKKNSWLPKREEKNSIFTFCDMCFHMERERAQQRDIMSENLQFEKKSCQQL